MGCSEDYTASSQLPPAVRGKAVSEAAGRQRERWQAGDPVPTARSSMPLALDALDGAVVELSASNNPSHLERSERRFFAVDRLLYQGKTQY